MKNWVAVDFTGGGRTSVDRGRLFFGENAVFAKSRGRGNSEIRMLSGE